MTLGHLIPESWRAMLGGHLDDKYLSKLFQNVEEEYAAGTVYPPKHAIFRALEFLEPSEVKVVIVGQDPYINEGEATGLSFGVGSEAKGIPPSLRNIFREIESDLGHPCRRDLSLESWAEQGVLLLNSTLTVKAGFVGSHQGLGWSYLTDLFLGGLKQNRAVCYMLWGRFARAKAPLLKNPNHLILEAAHPSPLAANSGFFGCKHFSKCNDYLFHNNLEPIRW